MRKTENEEVNIIMLEFFIKCRAQNIPVTSPMMQAKAVEIASSLQIEKFSASSGWLETFRSRNNINFGHYVVNLPMLTKKQHMIGKGTWLLLLKDML